jgi:hypothetical protein
LDCCGFDTIAGARRSTQKVPFVGLASGAYSGWRFHVSANQQNVSNALTNFFNSTGSMRDHRGGAEARKHSAPDVGQRDRLPRRVWRQDHAAAAVKTGTVAALQVRTD